MIDPKAEQLRRYYISQIWRRQCLIFQRDYTSTYSLIVSEGNKLLAYPIIFLGLAELGVFMIALVVWPLCLTLSG
jgi:hypothetical protein